MRPGCKSVVSAVAAICQIYVRPCHQNANNLIFFSPISQWLLQWFFQAIVSPEEPFQEPLTQDWILQNVQYKLMANGSYCTYHTLASRRRCNQYLIVINIKNIQIFEQLLFVQSQFLNNNKNDYFSSTFFLTIIFHLICVSVTLRDSSQLLDNYDMTYFSPLILSP